MRVYTYIYRKYILDAQWGAEARHLARFSDLRTQIADLNTQISDFRTPISDLRSPEQRFPTSRP